MANDNDTAIETNLIHLAGADLFSSLMINALVVTLIQSGTIVAAALRENVDTVLLGLERKGPGPGSGPKAYANARERLQQVIAMLGQAEQRINGAAGA